MALAFISAVLWLDVAFGVAAGWPLAAAFLLVALSLAAAQLSSADPNPENDS